MPGMINPRCAGQTVFAHNLRVQVQSVAGFAPLGIRYRRPLVAHKRHFSISEVPGMGRHARNHDLLPKDIPVNSIPRELRAVRSVVSPVLWSDLNDGRKPGAVYEQTGPCLPPRQRKTSPRGIVNALPGRVPWPSANVNRHSFQSRGSKYRARPPVVRLLVHPQHAANCRRHP